MAEEKKEWGGRRVGAGRPKGTIKEQHNQRPQHQLRAFDDEWDLIRRFAKLVKHGDLETCRELLEQAETKK